jgi:hypothetical protein
MRADLDAATAQLAARRRLGPGRGAAGGVVTAQPAARLGLGSGPAGARRVAW